MHGKKEAGLLFPFHEFRLTTEMETQKISEYKGLRWHASSFLKLRLFSFHLEKWGTGKVGIMEPPFQGTVRKLKCLRNVIPLTVPVGKGQVEAKSTEPHCFKVPNVSLKWQASHKVDTIQSWSGDICNFRTIFYTLSGFSYLIYWKWYWTDIFSSNIFF